VVSSATAAPTAVTAVAGLALLMEGSTPSTGTDAPHIRKAIEWLEEHSEKDGKIGSGNIQDRYQYVTAHARALLFLACAYDVDDDTERRKRLGAILNKAVEFVVGCQTARGGWSRIRPVRETDDNGVSTATVLEALFAARKVGIAVPSSVTDKGLHYLVRCTTRDGGVVFSEPAGTKLNESDAGTLTTSAAAVSALTADRRLEQVPMWAQFGARGAEAQLPYLRNNGATVLSPQYYIARTAHALGETGHQRLQPGAEPKRLIRWSTYRTVAFKAIKDAQEQDGTWSDQYSGPAYATALALIILQLDNDYLPAFSR
jgi:hypothetical protein